MTIRLLLATSLAVAVMLVVPGCGGAPKPPAPAPADTTAETGAICDTTLDTTAAVEPTPVETAATAAAKPAEPVAEKPVERPKELPKMWDFGSENCIPCKEMLHILTPMMAEYKGRVDIRIINVYEDRERTQQFRIVTIPTQVFISPEGKELYRHIGVYPADSIVARFREFGWE
ncbi:MAG: thioredoxin family protein [bacterium]